MYNKENIKYCVSIDDSEALFFDHVHIFAGEQITFHQHDTWELSYVIKGSGTRVVGDAIETFTSGEVVFLPPNMPHCWSFTASDCDTEGKIENITILFSTKLLEQCSQTFPEIDYIINRIIKCNNGVKFDGDTLTNITKIMLSMISQTRLQRISSFLLLLEQITISSEKRLLGSYRKTDRDTEKIQQIYRYVMNNYPHRISLNDVADIVSMNRSSLCIFFKRVKGVTFFSFLNEYRIDIACSILRNNSEMNISDICYAVGFEDIPYFNRVFKRIKKCSPLAYKANGELLSK